MVQSYKKDLPLSFKNKPHEALINVWWTGVLLKKESKRFFRPYIASEAQFNTLMILKYIDKPLTQNNLSERLLVDKSNITGLIDNMEKIGIIKRKRVKGDRRSYHIILTPNGKKLIDKLDKLYEQKVQKIMFHLTDKDCDELIHLTIKMRQELTHTK